ncbi:hypothetical protein LCGC14_0745300 [marine sediment metagenome]|uniref:Uncharacterized protein n=1 Tax=marine sediment metagenome TaxID=412755 RepID=A0A0F9QQE9_9ZZZZ
MSEPQTLEEAFGRVQTTTAYTRSSAGVAAALEDAVRALALAVLEEAVRDGGQGLGSSRLRRRIEGLGKAP